MEIVLAAFARIQFNMMVRLPCRDDVVDSVVAARINYDIVLLCVFTAGIPCDDRNSTTINDKCKRGVCMGTYDPPLSKLHPVPFEPTRRPAKLTYKVGPEDGWMHPETKPSACIVGRTCNNDLILRVTKRVRSRNN